MKIGIISFFLNGNNGSNLQALALQYLVRKKGHEVEHIKISRNKKQKLVQYAKDLHEAIIHPSYLSWIFQVIKRSRNPVNTSVAQPKEFGLRYTSKNLEQLTDDAYDAYIVGSDQIWSPLKFPFDEGVFLPKVSKEKKMAYAVSFGVDIMPNYNIGRMNRLLKGFQYISVREASVIKNSKINLGHYEEVLDPTLLLSREDWDELVKCYAEEDREFGRYALCYFLDEPTVQQVSIMNSLCKDSKLDKVICIGKGAELLKEVDAQIVVVRVENLEFVKIIKESSIVFTDSFHGTIFSIIYNKYLAIFHRNNGKIAQQFNRIQELADKLRFEDLIVREGEGWNRNSIYEFEYMKTNQCICEQCDNAKRYLYGIIEMMERMN